MAQLCAAATYGLGYPTLFVDEAGKKRQTWTDGLGRVIEVDEPDAANNLTLGTCYSYDLLDNLTQVNQGGQIRRYTYDRLSRLTSVTTPESGMTTFAYGNMGFCSPNWNDVCIRTNARGVVTTYFYDALGRLTGKTYSDGTPFASFFYDEPSVTFNGTTYPLANTKGRLSHTSAAGEGITIYSYDAAGRVQDYWQCSFSNCSSPSFWNMHYTYDGAGDLATSTSFGYTVTNSLNTAQQITQISSSFVDGTHPADLAQSIRYTPFGAIEKLVNGCAGAGCLNRQEFYSYNNRTQPVMIQVGTSGSPNTNACLGSLIKHFRHTDDAETDVLGDAPRVMSTLRFRRVIDPDFRFELYF